MGSSLEFFIQMVLPCFHLEKQGFFSTEIREILGFCPSRAVFLNGLLSPLLWAWVRWESLCNVPKTCWLKKRVSNNPSKRTLAKVCQMAQYLIAGVWTPPSSCLRYEKRGVISKSQFFLIFAIFGFFRKFLSEKKVTKSFQRKSKEVPFLLGWLEKVPSFDS